MTLRTDEGAERTELVGRCDHPSVREEEHKLEEEERAERLLELRKHLSDLMILFRQAASWLQPFDLI